MAGPDRCCCGVFHILTGVRILAAAFIVYKFVRYFTSEKYYDNVFIDVLINLLFVIPWVLVFVGVAKGRSLYLKPAVYLQTLGAFVFGIVLVCVGISALFPDTFQDERLQISLNGIFERKDPKIERNVNEEHIMTWNEVAFDATISFFYAFNAFETLIVWFTLMVWSNSILRSAHRVLKEREI